MRIEVLCQVLLKRGQPETNTFHLPFGEMTITLDDVAAILRIPVIGWSVSYNARLTFADAVITSVCNRS